LAAQATEKGALAVDARWIYASKVAKKLLSWHKYQIGKPEETKRMDPNMRDLRELAIHLARYNPVGPTPDDTYLKLTRKVSRNLALASELSTPRHSSCLILLPGSLSIYMRRTKSP
jgi:hypothetical protein